MTPDNAVATRPGTVPPGYGEALYWKLTGNRRRVVLVNVLAMVTVVPWGALFFWLALRTGWLPPAAAFASLNMALAFVVATIAILVLHELVHGAAMRLYGAHTEYGAILSKGMFYATAPGFAFPRNRYLVVVLAPLVVLSLLAVIAMALLAGSSWVMVVVLAATLNASGAAGDLWMSALVLRYPPAAYIVDEKDGMRVFVPGAGDDPA